MATAENTGFRDATSLVNWTLGFLILAILTCAISAFSHSQAIQLLNDLKNGKPGVHETFEADAEATDARQQVIAIGQIATFVISGILMLCWISRANFNARQLGAEKMEFTPGWAVGYFFVPFVNLWKPYQIMQEIWQASRSPENWKRVPAPSALVGWWWATVVCSRIVARAAMQVDKTADDLNEILGVQYLTMFSDLLDIVPSLLLFTIIRRVDTMQREHADGEGLDDTERTPRRPSRSDENPYQWTEG